jgi:hypothetical protein
MIRTIHRQGGQVVADPGCLGNQTSGDLQGGEEQTQNAKSRIILASRSGVTVVGDPHTLKDQTPGE